MRASARASESVRLGEDADAQQPIDLDRKSGAVRSSQRTRAGRDEPPYAQSPPLRRDATLVQQITAHRRQVYVRADLRVGRPQQPLYRLAVGAAQQRLEERGECALLTAQPQGVRQQPGERLAQ